MFWQRLFVSWRFDDEPGDQLEVRRFVRLRALVRNDERAFGLQPAGQTFAEGDGNGFDRFREQGGIGAHVRAILRLLIEQVAQLLIGRGFLGAQHGYVYLTDTSSGPSSLRRASDITAERQSRREALLAKTRAEFKGRSEGNALVENYDQSIAEAAKLAGPQFMNLFQLDQEPADLRNRYGGEFGQRCLLTRRLLQGGCRFVEVAHNLNFLNGTGWDVHNDGIENQHKLIQELDAALSTLVLDLERCKLLDKTLIVVGTEFGRPASFDGGGGRGHHGKCFSVALAGGGLKNGLTIGETDELAMKIVSRPVSVPDLHATIYATLGIDTKKHLYAGDRPVPITDGGEPIRELFA